MASAVIRGRRSSARLLAGVLGLLLLGALVAGWMVAGAERDLRADQLQRTRMMAQALNPESVRALTGTPADLGSPQYRQLKAQLAAARAVIPGCRFISLVVRRTGGSVCYLVDS